MKCSVCGKEYGENAIGACPRCGFPAILLTDDSPETKAALQQTVDEYRKQLLGEFSVYITAYEYEKTSEEMTEKGERRILVASAEELSPGKEVWADTAFGVSDELLLHAILEKNGEEIPYTLAMTPPRQKDLWKVGAMLNDNLSLCFLVGSPEASSVSEPVELF